MKKLLSSTLAALSTLLNLSTVASVFSICLAGTLMTDGEPPFLLPSLAIATISILIRAPDLTATQFSDNLPTSNKTYSATLSWFLNALDWHQTPTTAGMVYNINGLQQGGSLTIPAHLQYVARRLSWLSDRPGGSDFQVQRFFAAWHGEPERVFSTTLSLRCYYLSFLLLFAAMITKSPGVGGAATLTLAVAAGSATFVAWRLVEHLEWMGPEGVEVTLSRGFLTAAWSVVGASLLANLLMMAAWWFDGSKASWMEEKGVQNVWLESLDDSEVLPFVKESDPNSKEEIGLLEESGGNESSYVEERK